MQRKCSGTKGFHSKNAERIPKYKKYSCNHLCKDAEENKTKEVCEQQYVREDNETNMLKNKMTIEHMNLHYGDFHALKDINLNIKENQITAFIGPSGCGKSTLLKSLNRMNDLVEGCKIDGLIALDGEDIYGNNMDVNLLRKRVGMVFQKANPFPMSIYDNVAFGPRTHGIHNKAQLDDIVEKSLRDAAIWDEVKDRLKKSALGVSGGQQQRAAIARALAAKPAIILADEPTGNLDSVTSHDVLGLLKMAARQFSQTLILITHDRDIAQLADRIVHIEDGKIIGDTRKGSDSYA